MRVAYCPAAQQAKLRTRIPASSTMLATFHSAPSPTTLRPDTSERPTHQSVRQNDQASSPSSTVCHEPIVQQACNAKGHSLVDPDLEELLALIAARQARRPADAKSKPGRFLPRRDLLQRFGRQLSSSDPLQTASSPTELVPQPQAKRVGLKESLARLFRSAYSRPPHTGLEDGHHR
ncbi:hypothetical protein BD413DRAFT_309113 [Trametes elegans]|nr:hypothetical protein BD413DRAFT_309113 [Trametes elegans]